ncbi:hypothetical protein BAFK78_I007 (plasmid) [Borreliella afzelii K78]|nr:hypothetical protein BAFK78_I007 [Borreliella afzelii K78]
MLKSFISKAIELNLDVFLKFSNIVFLSINLIYLLNSLPSSDYYFSSLFSFSGYSQAP